MVSKELAGCSSFDVLHLSSNFMTSSFGATASKVRATRTSDRERGKKPAASRKKATVKTPAASKKKATRTRSKKTGGAKKPRTVEIDLISDSDSESESLVIGRPESPPRRSRIDQTFKEHWSCTYCSRKEGIPFGLSADFGLSC